MLEADDIIVLIEERLDSISTVDGSVENVLSTVDGSVENVLCRIRKKLWISVFYTCKSIVYSEDSTNGI